MNHSQNNNWGIQMKKTQNNCIQRLQTEATKVAINWPQPKQN